jgi:hypothetical protein
MGNRRDDAQYSNKEHEDESKTPVMKHWAYLERQRLLAGQPDNVSVPILNKARHRAASRVCKRFASIGTLASGLKGIIS